jgi:hypothetical protein
VLFSPQKSLRHRVVAKCAVIYGNKHEFKVTITLEGKDKITHDCSAVAEPPCDFCDSNLQHPSSTGHRSEKDTGQSERTHDNTSIVDDQNVQMKIEEFWHISFDEISSRHQRHATIYIHIPLLYPRMRPIEASCPASSCSKPCLPMKAEVL